jgi:hypothetical protein
MNVLVDTSVWIDHLHHSEPGLVALLQSSEVIMHSAVLGELACGALPRRQEFLSLWSVLPSGAEISPAEGLRLVEEKRLWGKGLGWTDDAKQSLNATSRAETDPLPSGPGPGNKRDPAGQPLGVEIYPEALPGFGG